MFLWGWKQVRRLFCLKKKTGKTYYKNLTTAQKEQALHLQYERISIKRNGNTQHCTSVWDIPGGTSVLMVPTCVGCRERVIHHTDGLSVPSHLGLTKQLHTALLLTRNLCLAAMRFLFFFFFFELSREKRYVTKKKKNLLPDSSVSSQLYSEGYLKWLLRLQQL